MARSRLIAPTATRLPQNLELQSQDFNTTWAKKYLTTITSDVATDPDGGNNGDLIVPNGGTTAHGVYQTRTVEEGVTYAYSVYAKAENYSRLTLRRHSASGFAAPGDYRFHLDDGTKVDSSFGYDSFAIEDVGNGWYRCSVIATATSSGTSDLTWLVLDDSGTYSDFAGDTTSGIYLYGAQVENYSTVGTYTKTTSAAIPGGNRVLTRLGQNLQPYSEDFFNQWTALSEAAMTEAQAANPLDGTVDADELHDDGLLGSNINVRIQGPATTSQNGADHCFSVYAKKSRSSTQWIYLLDADSGGANAAYFDIVNGVVGTLGSDCFGQITDEGNGWFRCSVTGPSADTSPRYNIYLAENDNDLGIASADGTWGAYIYGAQIEPRPDGPGTYTATTTAAVPGVTITRASTASYVDHNGIIQTAAIGEDRTGYDPSDNSLRGLLVEEAATTLAFNTDTCAIYYSTSNDGITWDTGADTAPDGSSNFDRLNVIADAGKHMAWRQSTTTTGVDYCHSVFVKDDGARYVFLTFGAGAANDVGACFDLQTGTVSETNITGTGVLAGSGIEDYGSGVYRIHVAGKWTGTASYMIIGTNDDGTPGSPVPPNFTAVEGEDAFFWGPQLELGTSPSSHIINTAGSGTATRAADDISVADLSQISYSASAGSSLSRVLRNYNLPNDGGVYSFDDGSADNLIQIDINNSDIRLTIKDGGVSQATITPVDNYWDTEPRDAYQAAAWQLNDVALYEDAAQEGTDSSATIPTVDQLIIGQNQPKNRAINGWIKQLDYYNTRLSNDDLVTLSGGGSLAPPGPGKLSLGLGIGI